MDRTSWPVILIVVVATHSWCAPQTQSESGARLQQRRTEYEAWTQVYRAGPLKGWFLGHQSEVKVAISAIEGDEETTADHDIRSIGPGYRIRYGCSVSTEGRIDSFSVTALGSKGGGYPTMPDADVKRLDQLLADLPDDFSILPPPNRRLLLQVPLAGHLLVRVYDRANAPERILDSGVSARLR